MALIFFITYLFFTLLIIYQNRPVIVWEMGSAIYLIANALYTDLPWGVLCGLGVLILLIVLVSELQVLRSLLSRFFYRYAVKSIPQLSHTEEEALNAGDTWLEEEIFTGSLNWDRLAAVEAPLTQVEQNFIDNEVQVLCAMLDEWTISQDKDLPAEVWTYLREQGFFGLVIATEYGGKGYSARAHSEVVMKIASRSGVAAVTVMVPNSLGPGELLQYYGTPEQKAYYLPRLAQGTEIPCFALTEPGAGSDATSIDSEAIVAYQDLDGKKTLGLIVTVDKRWITLAPVATLIGLAVNLKDPEGLLQGEGQEGITCILISRDTPNLEIGNRHLPLDQPFMNGTIRGKRLFVSIDSIIGGQEKAGHGWQMLVECLSIGRSISLPALAAAASSMSYLTAGAFARIRRQFHTEIVAFEGIQEKLAEIAGLNYLINATRLLTVAAVYQHKKPSVASAIAKYFNTELSRKVVNHAMDVHGGRAVVTGPRNYLASNYAGLPISITVEGANIMTRNLLIFGQGSMACHPYIRKEFYAIARHDEAAFHVLLWQHIQYFLRNLSKALLSAWTAGYFLKVPNTPLKSQARRLARLTAAFAFLADFFLIYLGGDLKRKERLSARLADALSHLYMGLAVFRFYQQAQPVENQSSESHHLHATWALRYCLYQAQNAMIACCRNFSNRFLGRLLCWTLFPGGQTMAYPSDSLDQQLAKTMAANNDYRDWLKHCVYLSGDATQPVDRMEACLQLIIDNEALAAKVKDLKRYQFAVFKKKLAEKVAQGQLTQAEMDQLVVVERARWDAILVDEFTLASMKRANFDSVTSRLTDPFD